MKKEPKPPKLICPVCWRANCGMFLRITSLCIPAHTMLSYFRNFHRDVCPRCKRIRCDQPLRVRSVVDGKKVVQMRYCFDTPPKQRPKNTVLPQWWLTPEDK